MRGSLLLTAGLLLGLLAPVTARAQAPRVRPVVLVHGALSDPIIWRGTERLLVEAGYVPIALRWVPAPGQGAEEVARRVLLPAIRAGLRAAGFSPDARFHAVTHSVGGLLLRSLIEAPASQSAGEPPPLRPRQVASLVMISPPHQGAHTGVAALGCALLRPPWKTLVCDIRSNADFIARLGHRKPERVATAYLNIGVATNRVAFLAGLYDGDGDGRGAGHDNAVMAEAAWMEGAPFVLWRGTRRGTHFSVTCSLRVNRWILAFLIDGSVPASPARRRYGGDACAGLDPARG